MENPRPTGRVGGGFRVSEPVSSVAEAVAAALATLDVEQVRRHYEEQGEFVCLERWLPPALIDRLLLEVERVRPAIHRSFIPRHKKGGSVSFYSLLADAPTIVALYRAPALIAFLARVVGRPIEPCPPGDPHACALYFYTEPGDHIGFHFDTSHYRGARYTVLLGLVERSSSRLVCQLFKNDPSRAPVELRLATHPGTLVLFNGDTLWHAVTPLGEGEERVSLTLEYVTDPAMSPLRRLLSNLKDAFAYFGLRQVFLRRSVTARVIQ